jgi:uncharacterized protein
MACLRVVAALLLGFAGAAQSQQPDSALIDVQWGVKIPLRDGVRLNATLYRPRGVTTPLPVIFTLTPYIGDTYYNWGLYQARHGYVFAAVDVRGRGNSEGQFEPFVNEAKDGHDVVEWFARQPWSNGKTAMWGGSYGGFDQWSTIKEQPPHLTTIVPVAPAYLGLDYPFEGNIFSSYIMQWLTFTSGKAAQASFFADMNQWAGYARILQQNHLPYRVLDSIAGNRSTVFQKWLEHPKPDPYWEATAPTPEQYAKITQPILTITGHYDGDQLGTLKFYRQFLQYANPEAREKIYLVIGPWDHGGTRVPQREFQGLEFGPASMVDILKLNNDWYDWTMKGGTRPAFLEKRVAYYVAGAHGELWRYADSLGAIATERRTYYLTSTGGRANDAYGSGQLSLAKPGASEPDHYTYNPLDPYPFDPGVTHPSAISFVDQSAVVHAAGNGVIYHTEPFAEETEVAGELSLTAWMSLDVPDTDFQVTVYEILPDGKSIHLTTTLLRARYRENPKEEKLVPAGAILPYRFTGFPFFARRLAKGSRLRLFLRSPNSPEFEKNYNGGGVVANESGKDARTAHVKLYHDAEHPSALVVPITR